MSAVKKLKASRDDFGPTLGGLMRERHVTFRDLADKVELSAGYLNHLVHGNRPVPDDAVISRLATVLAVDPEHFREWRLRRVCEVLDRDVAHADRLYTKLAA